MASLHLLTCVTAVELAPSTHNISALALAIAEERSGPWGERQIQDVSLLLRTRSEAAAKRAQSSGSPNDVVANVVLYTLDQMFVCMATRMKMAAK